MYRNTLRFKSHLAHRVIARPFICIKHTVMISKMIRYENSCIQSFNRLSDNRNKYCCKIKQDYFCSTR